LALFARRVAQGPINFLSIVLEIQRCYGASVYFVVFLLFAAVYLSVLTAARTLTLYVQCAIIQKESSAKHNVVIAVVDYLL